MRTLNSSVSSRRYIQENHQENEETVLLYWKSIYLVALRVARTLAATTFWRRIRTAGLCNKAIRAHTRRSQQQGSRRLCEHTSLLIPWIRTRQEEHLSEAQQKRPLIPFQWEKASQHGGDSRLVRNVVSPYWQASHSGWVDVSTAQDNGSYRRHY
jgi:hypothetical protein